MDLYQGIVEDNEDPNKVGRVRIRIPSIHGNGKSGRYVPTNSLPWFEPCTFAYGGYHAGEFIVPPTGAMMWCAIEETDSGSSYYIYLGGMYGTGVKTSKEFNGSSVPLNKLETPEEAIKGYPGSAVLLKHPTGSVIYIDNTGAIVATTGKATLTLSGGKATLQAGNILIDGDVVNINP